MSELYSDLSPARREIRLLILAPGQARDEIHATLSVHSLNSDPEYEALSYVWGDPSIKQSIKLHDADFHVTLNLMAALRRMRLPNAARVLWVDAICIDQSDITERESQIAFMGDIYTKASGVLIWLGEDEERTDFAFNLLKRMAQGHHLMSSACEWDLKRLNDGTDTFPCTNDLHSLENVFTRPWWSRSWTLQEIILARTVIIFCGDSQILWSDLDSACLATSKHRVCCALCPKCRGALLLFLRAMQYLFLQRKEVRDAERPPLLDILSWNRFRGATDPRDKVYGVLGIAKPEQVEAFKLNYRCSIEEIYTKTIMDDIQRTGSLRSLIHAADNQACTDLDFPSWVADWSFCSANYRLLPTRQIANELFNASDGLEFKGTIKGSRVLSVAGFMVDQIHLVGEVADTSDLISILSSISSWRLLAKVDDETSRPYIGGGTIQNAFWRTTIADKISLFTIEHEDRELQWSRATQEVQTEYYLWRNRTLMSSVSRLMGQPPPANEPSDLVISLAVLRAIQDRKFFITKNGYIGIGPPETQPEDYIYILLGSKVPFILRKDLEERRVDSVNSEMQYYHTLVGDCYVHGIMDGEKIRSAQTDIAEVLLR